MLQEGAARTFQTMPSLTLICARESLEVLGAGRTWLHGEGQDLTRSDSVEK